MDCLSVFNPSRHLISSFIIIYIFFHSHSLFFYFAFLSLLLFCAFHLFFFFLQIWLQERLLVASTSYRTPPITYLPKHFGDRRFHQMDMSFEAYIKLMGHIKETNIQWVMEWWHISSMVHQTTLASSLLLDQKSHL